MFEAGLKKLGRENLLRKIKDRDSFRGARIIINGREYLNFSSNDYLGLSSHPKLRKAASDALKKYGTGSGASRLLSGGTHLHAMLEEKIASFKGAASALLFNSGYAANTGAIPAIAGEGDALFSDELNHASIIDGCRLSKAKTFLYRHKDTENLGRLLKKAGAKRNIIVTDAVFSMDGDIAPLNDILSLCMEHDAILYVDDAHGTGVTGGGRGTLKHFGIKHTPFIIEMGTLSKAAGSFGAFAAGEKNSVAWLTNKARTFIFSTALPSPIVAASNAALNIMEKDRKLIKSLWENRESLAGGLKALGLDTGESATPIIPVIMDDVKTALRLSAGLYKNGIYAPAIRPPAVKRPRIRFTATASHTKADIEKLLETLTKLL
jgi:8-amino-7-oxononanoate synthase